MIHAIAIRNKTTNQLLDYIVCPTGNIALRILSGVRINLNHREFKANEEFIEEKEIKLMNDKKDIIERLK